MRIFRRIPENYEGLPDHCDVWSGQSLQWKFVAGRSDVIMLANINNDTKEVKLVSVYRDTYLDTGDGIFQKCNAAYAKGGPEQSDIYAKCKP